MDPRRKRQLGFGLFVCTTFFAWLVLNHASPWTRKVVSDLTGTGTALLAVIWALQGPRRGKRVWSANLLTSYLALYMTGMGIWTYLELIVRQEAPFPSLADACYIPAQICLMAGIVLLPSRRAPMALRGRALLDGLMVMAATVTFSWYFVLGPTLLALSGSGPAKFVSIFYPLSDLSMLVCLLILIGRSVRRSAYTSLSIGVLGIVIADGVYGYMALKGNYASGSLIDIGWPAGQLFVGFSASALRSVLEEKEKSTTVEERIPTLWRSFVPYALVPALGVLLIYVLRHHADSRLERGVYIGSAALLGLILLRQVFAIVENNRLYGFLKEAYRDLETKTREAHDYAENVEQVNEELTAIQAELLSNNMALERANTRLEALATTDGMTGLPNHRTFQERLRQELACAERYGGSLSLLFLDVDHFKQYNDSFGHPAGDEALRLLAQLLRDQLRTCDIPARYGGEEFAVLLPDTDGAEALAFAERIRTAAESHPFPHRSVTLSLGVATVDAQGTPEALIAAADEALYAAKRSGRNRVESWQSAPGEGTRTARPSAPPVSISPSQAA